MSSNSGLCAEQAVEAEDTARHVHDVSLRERLYRLADAWRRLGMAYQRAEDLERKSTNSSSEDGAMR
jgi:hypothetical protein